MKNNDFEDRWGSLTVSSLFQQIRKQREIPVFPTMSERYVCSHMLQAGGSDRGSFSVEIIKGTTYDTWNLYYNGNQILCLGETPDGHVIRFYDLQTESGWLPEFEKAYG